MTEREPEVLHWVSEGKRNGDIGKIFGVSVRTIDKHIEHLFAKLKRFSIARDASEVDGDLRAPSAQRNPMVPGVAIHHEQLKNALGVENRTAAVVVARNI